MSQSTFPGYELRARREEMGYTVDFVYRKTRVPVHVIESLEAGDIQNLPSACYTVGFLKTYCQLLQMGPNRFVDTYQACMRPAHRFLRRSAPARHAYPPRWMGEIAAWAAVCAVIALGWFAYAVVVRPNADPGEQRAHAADNLNDLRVPEAPSESRR